MGEVALVPEYKAAFAQRVIVLQPKRDQIEPTFLLCAIKTNYVRGQMNQRATGSTVSGIRSSEFKAVKIPVPPKSVQAKFTEFFQRNKALKTMMKEQLQETASLARSLQQRAFNGEL